MSAHEPVSELIPPEAAAQIGREVSRARGEVRRLDWQRWAYAVRDENPLYFDPEHARACGYDDVICPPLYIQYAILGATSLDELRADGSSGAQTGDLRFPDCPRRMAGGDRFAFHAPCYDGTGIESVRTIADIEQKRGRSGDFVLVTWRATFTRDDGELALEATTSMIARP